MMHLKILLSTLLLTSTIFAQDNRLPNLPAVAYESITAYLGGLPAKYGDTTGGVIVIESKSYFEYYRQWKAQQEVNN